MAADLDVQIVEATEAHAHELAPRMREADILECMAASGDGPLASLVGSLRRSIYARALLFDGQVVALWGVAPVDVERGLGAAWLLGSDDLTTHPLAFWRLCRPELRRMLGVLPTLFNFVDARYERALRWAKALGFEVHPTKPFGPQQLPFHPIVFRLEPVPTPTT